MPKRRGNTSGELKREQFARAYVANGGIAIKAAAEVGLNPGNISHILQRPDVQNRISELAEKHGIQLKKCLKNIANGLDASKVVRIYETGETELHPDWGTRIECSKIGLKMHGVLDKPAENQGNVTFNILAPGNFERFIEAYYATKPPETGS